MFKFVSIVCTVVLWFVAAVPAQNAPYVGSYEALNNFDDITSEQMDVLRTKKILFASRSFGANMYNGLNLLAAQDDMYDILDSYHRWNVFGAGSDLTIIPETAFDTCTFVHFMATYWPLTERVIEVETLLGTAPWNFSEDADVVMVYYHTAISSIFPDYSAHMDSMQAHYPHIKFVYVCAGYSDSAAYYSSNLEAYAFNQQVLAKYKYNAPVYDLAAILSRDGECGLSYCPDYSGDPAGLHPNEDAGEIAMAKGFLVILKEMFFGASTCTSTVAPSVPTGLAGTPLSVSSVRLDWRASTHPECGIKYYQVRRNGSVVGSSYDTSYTAAGLAEGTEYTYAVSAVGAADSVSAWSDSVRVGTLADTTAPVLMAAGDTHDSTSVTLEFSETLDDASAENAGNYAIDRGVTVLSASRSGKFVMLFTSPMAGGVTYTVTVTGVTDASAGANPVAPGSQASFTYTAVTYEDDAIGYWAFDNSLEDGSDSAVTGSWNGTASYATGYAGQALDLDGTDSGSYVLIPDAPHLDGMENLTLSIWAKKNDAATGGQLFKKHLVYDMTVATSGIGGYFVTDGTGSVRLDVSGVANNDTGWHHYCVTYDGARVLLYLDGTRVLEDSAYGNAAVYSQGIYVGKLPWGSGLTFAGRLDEFRIFERALDSMEVVALCSGDGAGPQPNADSLAVRALLDANGDLRTVDGVATFDSTGRVIRLNIQTDMGGSVTAITSHIGQLTELTVLHAYGPDGYAHDGSSYLTGIDPAVANCTKLADVLLNDNDLADLPVEMTALTNLTSFSMGNNLLCDVSDTLRGWLDTYDPDWEATQSCAQVIAADRMPEPDNGISFVLSSGKLVISRATADGPMRAEVHALDGQRVYSIQGCYGTRMEWRTAGSASGLYMVTVQEDGRTHTGKAIVVHE